MKTEKLYYNEYTLKRVYRCLDLCGVHGEQAIDTVNQLQNRGILFREPRPIGFATFLSDEFRHNDNTMVKAIEAMVTVGIDAKRAKQIIFYMIGNSILLRERPLDDGDR